MSQRKERFASLAAKNHFDRLQNLTSGQARLWHYTSCATAIKAIENREFWLRNTRLMNDFSEIEHAQKILGEAIRNLAVGSRLNRIFRQAGITLSDFAQGFLLPEAQSQYFQTYIACLSEHDATEEKYGRLSMWRAYGGSANVALVFSHKPFQSVGQELGPYSAPVQYIDSGDTAASFREPIHQLEVAIDECRDIRGNDLLSLLKLIIVPLAFSIKHPAFREEREWRVYFNPTLMEPGLLRRAVESPTGIPEIVYKIPLENRPELGVSGMEPNELIEEIVIGPTEHPYIFQEALIEKLRSEGFVEPEKRVRVSDVPLRR